MSWFPRPAHPRVLLHDMRAFLEGNRRHRLMLAAMAIGMTSIIVTGFIIEARQGVAPEGVMIVYAEDFAADRSDTEIIAQQKIDQAKREAAQAERRKSFQKIDDAMTRLGL